MKIIFLLSILVLLSACGKNSSSNGQPKLETRSVTFHYTPSGPVSETQDNITFTFEEFGLFTVLTLEPNFQAVSISFEDIGQCLNTRGVSVNDHIVLNNSASFYFLFNDLGVSYPMIENCSLKVIVSGFGISQGVKSF